MFPKYVVYNFPSKMTIQTVHIFLFPVILIQSVMGSPAPTNLLATRIGPCSDNEGMLVKVSEFSIYTRIYDSSVTGRFNVTKDIEDGWSVKATMQKCQDIRNLDTCDYFKSFPVVKSGCNNASEYAEELDLYTMFFHHTQPRLSCPIKAGNYKVLAYPFFTEDNYLKVAESKISTSLFGYTFKLEGFLKRVKVLCIEAYLQLLYIREHNWINDVPLEPETALDNDDSADVY